VPALAQNPRLPQLLISLQSIVTMLSTPILMTEVLSHKGWFFHFAQGGIGNWRGVANS